VYSYGLVVLVLAYCGLRWGELSGLRISDLDLDAKHPRLTVKQTVVADKGYQRIEPPKDYEHRSIPIPAFLVGLLRAQIIGRSADAPVFYGIRTSTRLRNHVYRVGWFDNAAAAVGLKGLTPHELRHISRSGRGSSWGRPHPARAAAHRRLAGRECGSKPQGGAADAQTRLGRGDARRVRRPVR